MRVPDKTYLPFFYVHIKKINTHTSAHTATHTHTSAHTAIRTSIVKKYGGADFEIKKESCKRVGGSDNTSESPTFLKNQYLLVKRRGRCSGLAVLVHHVESGLI